MTKRSQTHILPKDALDLFSKLVEDRFGIQAQAADLRIILAERIKSTGTTSPITYLESLQSHECSAEWLLLARRLTIPETYFFRNLEHWDALQQYVLPALVRSHGKRGWGIRFWSAGCSTGEEPYTIAMALAEMGLSELLSPGGIIATDLVKKLLTKAEKAIYNSNSIRGANKERVNDFTHHNDNLVIVNREIKESIIFCELNLADPSAVAAFIEREGPFHIVFCRNVLIYLSPPACRRLLEQLANSLTEDGTLFLGHAEYPEMWTNVLEAIPVCDTILWHPRHRMTEMISSNVPEPADIEKIYSSAESLPVATLGPANKPEEYQAVVQAVEPKVTKSDESVPSHSVEPTIEPDSIMKEYPGESWRAVAEVINHAQSGRADEALATARKVVDRNSLWAEAYYVLGIALEMTSQAEMAIDAYSKALFLDSEFAHAYWRMAMVLAANDQIDQAVTAARQAIGTIAKESKVRIRYFSDIDREILTQMMEHTLEWLLQQQNRKSFARPAK